jgi:ribosomal protein L11 methyltransferase
MPQPDTLLKLELTVPATVAEEVAYALGELSPQGFEEHEDPGPLPTVRYVAYGEPAEADALGDALEGLARTLRAAHGDNVRLARSAIPQQNWREAWKAHFTLQRVDRFVIRPSWIDYAAAGDELLIHLDPGSAFGTGLHETTRLCLRALLALDAQGVAPAAVLDFGCGTGILGIGACRLWPCAAIAVDDDPLAISACEENAGRNGLTDRIRAQERLPPEGTFGLVLANVSRPVLTDFAPRLAAATALTGRLVLSGLLATDRDAILAAYAAVGLSTLAETQEGDWRCLTLGRAP